MIVNGAMTFYVMAYVNINLSTLVSKLILICKSATTGYYKNTDNVEFSKFSVLLISNDIFLKS